MFSITLQTPDTTVTANDVLGRLGFAASSETGSDAVLVSAIIKAVAEDTFDANNNPTSLVFCTANSEDADNSERMRINNDGDVGIGTSSPLFKLDVNGSFNANSVRVNDAFTLPTTDGANGQTLVTDGSGSVSWGGAGSGGGVGGVGTSNYAARWTSSTVLGTGVIYDNGTNVGIGTASPSQKLEVNGIIKSSNLISDSITFGSTDIISGGSNIILSSILNDIILTTWNSAADHIHCTNAGLAGRPSVDINPDAANIDFTVFHDTSTSVPLFHCDADLEKIGVNTITPATLFHLRKDSTYSSENTYAIKISDGNDPETHGMLLGVDSTNDIASIQAVDPGTSWARNLSLQAVGGNVGVGTITPTATTSGKVVHIAHETTPELHLTNDATGHTASDGAAIDLANGTLGFNILKNLGNYKFNAYDAAGASKELLELATYGITFNKDNNDCNFRVKSANTNHLIFADASVDRLGIGTETPQTKFHVSTGTGGGIQCTGGFVKVVSPSSNTSSDPYISVQGKYSGSNGTQVKIQSYQTYGTLQSDNNSDPIALQPVDGNVGVHGITAPAAPLHVGHDNNTAGIRVEDTSTGTYLEIGESAYTASDLYTGITHSGYTASTEYMLLSAGSHTFVSAKTGYSSFIRGGGNSTSYQLEVSSSKFRVGADVLLVNAEGLKAKGNIYIDRHLLDSGIAVGWHTIAVNRASRACGRFGLTFQASGRHQGIIFYASHYYGNGNQISILHNEKYASSNPIAKIRIKEGGTYDGCLLQVYIDDATYNGAEIFLLGDNINSTGWVVTDWVPDGTDPVDTNGSSLVANFSSLTNVAVEVNLDDVEFGTTGNSVFQGTVTCDSSVTASSLVKSGGTSSQFLKADGSVDTSTYLTSVAFSDIAAAAIVTEAEGISSNDNDTTLPTSAAVKDYVDANSGSSNLIRGSFVVTSSTQTFTVSGGYNANTLDVYQNGVKLFKGSLYDYQETSGNTQFTLTNAATNGDLIEYVALNASTSATGNTSLSTVSVTSNQTDFSTTDTISSTQLVVFLNGVKLVEGTSASNADYEIVSTNLFRLHSTAVSGDVVEYIIYGATVASSNLAKTGDTMTGNLTVNADLIVTGYKETHTDNGNTGTSQTIDISDSTLQTYTLTGNCTFTMPTADAGRSFTMFLKTGAGSFTATFTGAKFPSNTSPVITTDANRMDIITFYSDGTNWYGSIQQEYHI
jgi:hypothetical protein